MLEKFQATLVGFAIGDALAAPIEDVVRTTIDGATPITSYAKAFPSHPLSHLAPGQFSDETQVMIVVAESVIASHGFSIDDLTHRFVDWYHGQKLRSAWRFPSNTMMKACRKLAGGTHWNQAGFPSAGAIAAARAVPLALAFWRTPALLKDAIEKSCRLTHTDSRATAAAIVLATAIRMGIEGSEPAADVFVNTAIERAQMFSQEVPRRLKTFREVLKLDPAIAMDQLGTSGYALEAVPAALYWFFRHPHRFDDMIIGAANVGGDADAIAGMAGAVFGAFNGLTAINDRWLAPLEGVPHLKQLGADLYRLSLPSR